MTNEVPVRQRRKFRRLVVRFALGNLRAFPWRKRTTPYRILVAELMLQRTGAVQVAPVFERFLKMFPRLSLGAQARPAALARVLFPLGRTDRHRLVRRALRYLVQEHAGRVPDRLDLLMSVPAVGPYTARAVLCFAYGRSVGLLDPNVYRLLHRVFGIASARKRFHTDQGLWDLVDKLVPRSNVENFNWAVLDIASTLCLTREPGCRRCPLIAICRYGRSHVRVAA